MNSLGLPVGFEVFHDVKDMDDLDDISLGSTGDVSLITLTEMGTDDDTVGGGHKDGTKIDESEGHQQISGANSGQNDDRKRPAQEAAESEPRMVSHDSMVTVRAANVNNMQRPQAKSSSQTPWDSLKSLVENKRKTKGGNLLAPQTQSGGMVSRPSTFLREAMYGSNMRHVAPHANQEFQPETKKPKVEDLEVQNHVLHKACMKRGAEAEMIAAILKIDPNLAGKSHQIYQVKEVYDCASYQSRSAKVKEKYCYPLNIAIRNQVQYAAIELLVKAAPQVATMPDGCMKEGSLSVLLKNNPNDTQLADLLLLSNPACTSFLDKHKNTPLHIACQYGAALSTVKHLCILHPQALKMRNQFGQTPIQVAQRSNRSLHLASYLFTKQRGIF